MKITYYVAISSDGFIAREDGDVSWLHDTNIDMADTGYDEFFADIDGLVMGRSTYDVVFQYGSWPYGDKPTWVCTSQELRGLDGANLRVVGTVADVVREAASEGIEHLWLVGGGKLASSFIEEGGLSHLSLSEMPIELGAGIPLLARHRLEELSIADEELTGKKGFRQRELVLRTEVAG
ncbi:MAG: dihydrofolate reductase family protein [Verrucomicrobiota bacterium]